MPRVFDKWPQESCSLQLHHQLTTSTHTHTHTHTHTLSLLNNYAPPLPPPGLANDVEWHCDKLKKLDVSHNYLQALPDTFFDLSRMVALNVSYNHLQEIPLSCCWGCVNLVSACGQHLRLIDWLPRLHVHLVHVHMYIVHICWRAYC